MGTGGSALALAVAAAALFGLTSGSDAGRGERTVRAAAAQPSAATAAAVQPISGAIRYVSPDGSDRSSGRSPKAAWRTVRRVNDALLRPGDGVLFEGGRTFADRTLTPSRSGAANRPIVYGSYGRGRARLPRGIYLRDVSGLAFQNLDVSRAHQGVLASQSGTASHITIERLRISRAQIAINSASDSNTDWTIRDNVISQIGDSGMILSGEDFTVTHNSIVATGRDRSIDYPKHGIYLQVVDALVARNTIGDFETSGISVRRRDSVIEHNAISDGKLGLAWHQYDRAAGKSYWRHNTITGTTQAGIYVSPRDRAGPTRESFVITGNTLAKRAGVYIDLQPTSGTYTVSANDEN